MFTANPELLISHGGDDDYYKHILEHRAEPLAGLLAIGYQDEEGMGLAIEDKPERERPSGQRARGSKGKRPRRALEEPITVGSSDAAGESNGSDDSDGSDVPPAPPAPPGGSGVPSSPPPLPPPGSPKSPAPERSPSGSGRGGGPPSPAALTPPRSGSRPPSVPESPAAPAPVRIAVVSRHGEWVEWHSNRLIKQKKTWCVDWLEDHMLPAFASADDPRRKRKLQQIAHVS